MIERFRSYCLWLLICPVYYRSRKYSNLDRSLWSMVGKLRLSFEAKGGDDGEHSSGSDVCGLE